MIVGKSEVLGTISICRALLITSTSLWVTEQVGCEAGGFTSVVNVPILIPVVHLGLQVYQ